MLAEITGALQIFSCSCLVGATLIWFKVWRDQLNKICDMRWELVKVESRIVSLEGKVQALMREHSDKGARP